MSAIASTRTPTYRRHKPSGRAVVTIDGKDFYLGPYGTKQSKAEYDRRIAEWLANGRRLPAVAADVITVADLIERFCPWMETHYRRPDGTPTSEVGEFRYSLRPLNHLYGSTIAGEFGTLAFKAVRQLLITGYKHPRYGEQKPQSRGVVNKRMDRIRRMFKWATENELVPPSVFHGLLAVRGLQRGRSEARETEAVKPVNIALVDAVRPHVSRQVEALIDLQLRTGARPGELCVKRACDLDTTERIWVYKPAAHKTEHHGHAREIYLGPHAQDVVKRFLKTDLSAYLFSPREAEADRLLAMRAERKTKVQPSQVCRKPKRQPGDCYDVAAYRRAIARACDAAFPLPCELAPKVKPNGRREKQAEWQARLTAEERAAVKSWRHSHAWHPHQLRHNAGTSLRKEFGVEIALILGHSTAFTTEIYAEADRVQAMEVIGKIG